MTVIQTPLSSGYLTLPEVQYLKLWLDLHSSVSPTPHYFTKFPPELRVKYFI